MKLYRYVISKLGDKYLYSSDEIDTGDKPLPFIDYLRWDRANRIDLPDQNKIMFLFDSKLSMESFGNGIHFEHNINSNFQKMSETTLQNLPEYFEEELKEL